MPAPVRPDTVRAKLPAHRVAVIGDVAGHLDELRTELDGSALTVKPADCPAI